MSREPMVNFAVHQVRAGPEGAPGDFEQMIAQLVQAHEGHAHRVFAHPGDWGIDVLTGALAGEVTVWQAKYFLRGVASAQRRQIEESFASAVRPRPGYRVSRWILCVPSSLDARTLRWWYGWRAERERRHGLVIELWDETELRRLLLHPSASHVRRHYYDPYRAGLAEPPSPPPLPPIAAPVRWAGGEVYTLDGARYLLHNGASQERSADHAWTWREATADRLDDQVRVRLRETSVDRPTTEAQQRRTGLEAQAALLTAVNGRAGLPRVAATRAHRDRYVLATYHPPGRPWTTVFRSPVIADPLTAASVVAVAADVGTALAVLHQRCTGHGALDGAAIIVEERRGRLRDAGCAAMPLTLGDARAADVHDLAAVVYRALTGHPPTPGASVPIHVTHPGFPAVLDDALIEALDRRRRPDLYGLVSALRAGHRELVGRAA